VNPSLAHAELIATFRRAQADAAHKFGLIKTVEKKGPKAIQAAIETAAKPASIPARTATDRLRDN
jgi:enoyl-CoA hydratase/carnithine racemase